MGRCPLWRLSLGVPFLPFSLQDKIPLRRFQSNLPSLSYFFFLSLPTSGSHTKKCILHFFWWELITSLILSVFSGVKGQFSQAFAHQVSVRHHSSMSLKLQGKRNNFSVSSLTLVSQEVQELSPSRPAGTKLQNWKKILEENCLSNLWSISRPLQTSFENEDGWSAKY